METISPASTLQEHDSPASVVREVLVINQYAVPRSEGGGTRHVELFDDLPGFKVKIFAAARNHTTQRSIDNTSDAFRLIKTLSYSGPSFKRVIGLFDFSFRVTRAALKSPEKWAVVYASTPQPVALVSGLVISRLKKIPLVIEIRDLWPQSLESAGFLDAKSPIYRILNSVVQGLYRRADAIVVVTPAWVSDLVEMGVNEEKIHVISNGSDLSRENVYSGALRTPPRAVFAGSHGVKDGLQYILAAAEELPHVEFTLIGDGANKDWAVREAAGRGLSNLEFLPPVPKEELARTLEQYDIGVHVVSPLPIFARGMSPNKLFDYLAVGLPVVSNAVHGLSGVLRDGQCGRLGDWDDLVNCLRGVLAASPEKREQWSRNARDLVASTYSRRATRLTLQRLLERLTDGETVKVGETL